MKSVWWHSATNEQRLAQINAAYELEMSIGQIAMNFQVPRNAIRYFLKTNDISWAELQHTQLKNGITVKKLRRGKELKAIRKIDNTAAEDAFTLFETNGRNFQMNYLESY